MITIAKLKRGDREALRILAAVIENRPYPFRGNEICLISKGPLPKILNQVYGGTCYIRDQDHRNLFRIRGKGARQLLRRLIPFFMWRGPEARLALRQAQNGHGNRS